MEVEGRGVELGVARGWAREECWEESVVVQRQRKRSSSKVKLEGEGRREGEERGVLLSSATIRFWARGMYHICANKEKRSKDAKMQRLKIWMVCAGQIDDVCDKGQRPASASRCVF